MKATRLARLTFLPLLAIAALPAANPLLAQSQAPAMKEASAAQAPAVRTIPDGGNENPCHTVVVYELGKADNFAPGPDPVSPSLALDAMLQTGHPVRYDEGTCDHYFGDTFTLDPCVVCCGICSAALEITMHGCGSALDCNDYIYVGQAPFSGAGYLLWGGYVTEPHCSGFNPSDPTIPDISSSSTSPRPLPLPATVVKKIQLDPRKVAELLCERKVKTLDVFIQDDQIVDSMRLVITKP
jgi:hypothetical protein